MKEEIIYLINALQPTLKEIGEALQHIAWAIESKPIQVNIENNNDN